MIAVAATDELGLSAPFSYSGPTNVIAAPGDGILSTVPDGTGYDYMSGTSMAAPQVSGVLARYVATHDATPAQVLTAVQDTAIDLETPGPDDDTGAGLLNPYELLTGDPAPADPDRGTVPTTPRGIRATAGVDQLTVRWDPPSYAGHRRRQLLRRHGRRGGRRPAGVGHRPGQRRRLGRRWRCSAWTWGSSGGRATRS